jgi:carbon monoxide dehydrogenase subunit G
MYHMVQTAAASATSAAPPDAIFELLKDPTTWPSWSGMDTAELHRPGEDEPYGVGSIRALTRGRVHGFDEVVELVPGKRFSYLHLRGLPVRDYRGDVDLEPAGTGTRITWRVSFRPRYPGTGWIWRIGVRRMLRQTVAGLAGHAGS